MNLRAAEPRGPTERATLVVFAKAPRPGQVKTRMCPPFTPERAAALYEHMLDDVLAASAAHCAELALDGVVAVHPPEACGEIASRCPKGFRVVAQQGGDLSQRMTRAVAESAAAGVPRVLLRSSDSPLLDVATLREALDELGRVELVICPDLGGGYNLVGLSGPAPGLFDHPMSTRSVLDDTLANARALGLRSRVLAPSPDVDRAVDLAELERARDTPRGQLCPRTLAFLDEHDLWHASLRHTSHTSD